MHVNVTKYKKYYHEKTCTWSNWDILKKHLNITLTLDRVVCYKIP